jgi:ABC-2 type transport system ATP-binding protein
MTERGTTIFFSSHVMEVVEKLCTRLAIIARGRIVGEGTLDELRAQIGNAGASLEDIFVQLVSGPVPKGMAGEVPINELDWLSTS